MARVDVLIPTYRRPAALAATLATLIGQTFRDFRVIVSDQTEDHDPLSAGEVLAALRVLRARGNDARTHTHLPRRGIAEHRQFLLSQASAPYGLFLDDDVLLEPTLLSRLVAVIGEEGCSFVGSALIGLSFIDDVRPEEQRIEFWDGRVQPEVVAPATPQWQRYKLHNASNLWHVQKRLGLEPESQRIYRVAWVGGCVLYDLARLREVGGFSFHRDLP
ncbi:MAG: glycosyltransferase family 2 protein, partial [Actinomycetota bacterium]|nr:glycosyltransferase family 2 protein [Actinomycetota bacterium]